MGKKEAEARNSQTQSGKLPDAGKIPDAGKYWKQEEKGLMEDEIVEWHHRLNGHEFEQILGDGEGQGSLACYSHKELDRTERLENNNSEKGRVALAEEENRRYRQTLKSGELRSYSDLDEKERKLFGVRIGRWPCMIWREMWEKNQDTVLYREGPPFWFSKVKVHLLFNKACYCWGFPGGLVVKDPPANAGDASSIPGSGRWRRWRCLEKEMANPLHHSCLWNAMDRGAWQATVHGVANESDTIEQLNWTEWLNNNNNCCGSTPISLTGT